jgi:monovalent cation/hydrogen antiporter
MAGVAVVAHLVAGIGWGPATVLGAVLGPTDPVAATSVLRRVGAPDRISTILEGESLVNDGSALTVYKLAVAAVASGAFSIGSTFPGFLLALLGVVIGLIAGVVSVEIRRRIDEAPIEVSVSLLTAYLAYIPAERIGSSGILAAVAAGLYTGRRSSSILSAPSRLQMLGFWDVMTFLLESVLFLLIGLQLQRIIHGMHGGIGVPLLAAGAVLVTAIAVRIGWMFLVPMILRLLRIRVRGPAARPGSREQAEARRAELFVLGWSGMRGAVSLAAALALPLTTTLHRPFPARDTVIFIAYITIVAGLVLAGLTLPFLVRRLGLAAGEELARAEAQARVQLAHTALQRIDEASDRGELPDDAVEQLRSMYETRVQRLAPQAAENGYHDDESEVAWQLRRLQQEVIGAERTQLRQMRLDGSITAEAARRIERDLDLEESRIAA